MMKKRILCLVLILCAALVLTACQQQETYPNQPRQDAGQAQQQAVQQEAPTMVPTVQSQPQQINFDDGSYDPSSEEGGQEEQVAQTASSGVTSAPIMQSEYAGATPVKIDPVDKPTPTPLPTITFSYATYTASNLHLTFDGPAGWVPDDSAADAYVLRNPDPSMDYEAKVEVRTVNVGKSYTQKELTTEVKAQADALRTSGNFLSLEPSNTATRHFIADGGVYIAYKGTLNDGSETGVAGRIIVNTVNNTLYILHVSYPRALADTFADGVYNKVRHSMKLAN